MSYPRCRTTRITFLKRIHAITYLRSLRPPHSLRKLSCHQISTLTLPGMDMPSMGNLKDSVSTSIPHLTTCLTTSGPQSILICTTLPIMSQHRFHLYLRTRSLRLISSSRRDPSLGMRTYQRRHRRTRARARSDRSGRAPKTTRIKHLSAREIAIINH